MEEAKGHGDFKLSSIRSAGSSKSPLSGKHLSRNLPSMRRSHSGRSARRESKGGSGCYQWFGGNRVVFWLILITMWAYLGFYVQSKWAHGEHQQKVFVHNSVEGGKAEAGGVSKHLDVSGVDGTNLTVEDLLLLQGGKESKSRKSAAGTVKKRKRRRALSRSNAKKWKHIKASTMELKLSNETQMPRDVVPENKKTVVPDDAISRKNTSYGLLVGPFGMIEDSILEWSPEKRRGTCDRRSEFARLVWSRRFVLVVHDLYRTRAPITMMEFASELLSCGGYVHMITLSTKGDLRADIKSRGIKLLEKGELSTKTAMRADLIIAGSAACWSWIEEYYKRFTIGSSQVLWWIMENKRVYFDKSKHVLGEVKKLAFLSDAQSRQWLSWCEEEKIKLRMEASIVPLAISDELAFVAGLPCSLNTPMFSVEKMQEKRNVLRDTVRKEMGLSHNDTLLTTLTDINSGKGQLFLLESFLMISEQNLPPIDVKIENFVEERYAPAISDDERSIKIKLGGDLLQANNTGTLKKKKKRRSRRRVSRKSRGLLSEIEGKKGGKLNVLIGSVGAKRNSPSYVRGLLSFLSLHSNLSKSLFWTSETTRVSSLYAASDVFVINSQGLGETFGRVTIEAMAFGLPVIGTDAGGTKEIVDDKITGLLHPVGREGILPLAQNIQFLLNNPSARELLGRNGRQKVEKMYLKKYMYIKLGKLLFQCMKSIK